jgi:hypothetical protein
VRDVGFDGAAWVQRAEVSGFTTELGLHRILTSRPDGVTVSYHRGSQLHCTLCRVPVAVTLRDGEPWTWSGVHLSRSDIKVQFGSCPKSVWGELYYAAWQVSMIDCQWERNDVLWPWLQRLAHSQEQA